METWWCLRRWQRRELGPDLLAYKSLLLYLDDKQRLGNMANPRILIIGGGAGGLELATSLGNKLGK